MDLNKTIKKIEANREQIEASFVFCLWKDPQRYDDYKNVNEGIDKTLICEEPLFYFRVGRGLRQQGFSNIDNITLDTYLSDKPTLRRHYEELNGWRACKEMMDLVDPENADSFYNQISKMNTLKILATRFDEMLSTPERFNDATNEEVYDAFELLTNSVALTTGNDSKIEDLVVDEKYIQQCNAGMDQGISYAAGAPLLNYLTLGAPVGDMYLFAGHSGTGKAIEINTPVLTYNGFVPMKDIHVGDLVISEDGKPYPVIGVFPQGLREGYRVTFEDGSYVDCDKEHLWKFKTFADVRRDGTPGSHWHVETLHDMMTKYKFKVNGGTGTFNLSIPVAKPVERFCNEEALPIPPYALGALIGDGYLKHSPITFTNPEKDIVEKIEDELKEFGEFHHFENYLQHNFCSNGNFGKYKSGKPINELGRRIRELGLDCCASDKFIPKMYLKASKEKRFALLQGLIDTDGSVNAKGSVSFLTASEQLAKDVRELIWSLGFRCSLRKLERVDKGSVYQINIYAKSSELFSSKKHTERFNNRRVLQRVHSYDYLKIVKIEKLPEPVEMQCISVASPDHTYICGDYIVTHNTSFIFENMVLPFAEGGTGVAIISNEMQSKAYKNMLLVHILTKELNYWKITRKRLSLGHFNEEELEMLRKAAAITEEKYSHIRFVKMFENDTSKVLQYIKRLARSGTKAIIYDTMKSDDGIDDKMWQALLMNSRRIFNTVSKEQVAMICTFQLALHTTNQRWLDATCLSNSKQIKEVVAQAVFARPAWQDEYTGEKFDCNPYRRNKDNPKIKEPFIMDKDKKYMVLFLNKTRSDEDGQTLLYQWDSAWNRWIEIGFCTIVNDHGMYDRR